MSPANQPPPHAPAAAHVPAAVLRQYAAGTLAAAERRQVERHTLACPLCADALEGYLGAAPQAIAPAALADLQQRLHARVAEAAEPQRFGGWWMRVAAAVLVLLVALGVWQWPNLRQPQVASTQPQQAAPESVAAAPPAPAPVPQADAAAAGQAPPEQAADAAEPAAAKPTRPAYAAAPAKPRRRAPRLGAPRPAPEVAAPVAASAAAASAEPLADAPVVAAAPPASVPDSGTAALALRTRLAAAPDTKTLSLAEQPKAAVAYEGAARRKAAMPAVPPMAPLPAGGYPALTRYLRQEQQLPPEAPRVRGSVKLKFMVEADGSLQNIQVVKGLSPEADAEAIRLVCEGPSWHPGIVNGRRTSMPVLLEVPFRD
ncbi:energy transducer TonB [Hymenobacter latericus]|uniref:energy transducer TonB n=1 Tax=Hymenobacter sp. YIM 151858-1 TaxID=2987688 RepID=UPI002226DCB8|nr:energy transducer TonB [Hymenobacter sp. YIM 151858-1]UYZ58303.1 energy transducer TonB [Hymenobacter sp. YIM 151858-1]